MGYWAQEYYKLSMPVHVAAEEGKMSRLTINDFRIGDRVVVEDSQFGEGEEGAVMDIQPDYSYPILVGFYSGQEYWYDPDMLRHAK